VGARTTRICTDTDVPLGLERPAREELADERLLRLAEVCVNPAATVLAKEDTAAIDLSQGPIDEGLRNP